MLCPGCGGEDLFKRSGKGSFQRHQCCGCGRFCRDKAARFSAALKAQALDMHLNNVGVRKIARFVGASPAGVLKWIRADHAQGQEQLNKHQALPEGAGNAAGSGAGDIIEMDEITTIVRKKLAAR